MLRSIFIFCGLVIVFSGCRNVWMEEILQPKVITFESNGGSRIESQTIYRNEKISEPQPPAMVNHDFKGWYIDNISFTAKWDFNDKPKKDMTLYAKWFNKNSNKPNGPHEPFKSIEELEAYLKTLKPSDTPYDILIDISNLAEIARILQKYPDIPINLILLSNDIASIGNFNFCNCVCLVGITIPDNVTTIEPFSFSYCCNLKSLTIGNNVTKIDIDAFYDCISLTDITIPESVSYIGECAFFNCDNLTSVTFKGKIYWGNFKNDSFPGNLQYKFYEDDPNNGTPGTYTRPNGASQIWTKQ